MLRELLARFDIDTSKAQSALQKLSSGIDRAAETLGALGDAFVGSAIVHGLSEFIAGQIEAGSRVNDLSERLGVGVEELQSFQFAAGLAGVGSEEAAKGLQFLNKNIGDALSGTKEAVETFSGLGISLKDSNGKVRETSQLLPEVADVFAAMGSDAERTSVAMKIFGKSGASLIPLLKGGSKALEETRAKFEALGGGMTKEFVAAADEAGDEIDALKFGLNNFKSQIVFAILPTVTKVAQRFQDWTAKLIKLEKTTNLAKAAWALFGSGAAVASAKSAAGFAKFLGLVPKDASFWKIALGLGEIALAVALVAGLALIFEDLWTGINGGDSATREWLNGLLGVEETNAFFETLSSVVSEIEKSFREMGPDLKPIVRDLLTLAKDAGPGIAKAFVFIVKAIVGATRLLVGFAEVVTKTIGAVEKFVKGDNSGVDNLGKDLGGAIDRAGNAVFGRGGLFDLSQSNKVTDFGVPARSVSAPTVIGPPAPPAAVTQQNKVEINISGVKDAQGAGRAAQTGTKAALDGELDRAMAASLSGG